MAGIADLPIKIFADGADVAGIAAMAAKPWVRGFTTNPTLMRKSGVTDYAAFAREVLDIVKDRPVSFEVFADDLPTMERQATEIASWAPNVNVKIPVTTTDGTSTSALVGRLSRAGVQVNITAVFTLRQVEEIVDQLDPATPAIISVFAGRIADTGVDPLPHMQKALDITARRPAAELLWASPREFFNIMQAAEMGCHIITVTNDILAKAEMLGKDLAEFSLETVAMFYRDATASGFSIPLGRAAA